MSKKSRSNRAITQEKVAAQPTNETEMDTVTMSDMTLGKSERNQSKNRELGAQ
ncbi:hypothetical protein [Halalkalibacter lacteus]|uniref:hypothetical protein n=1 Tax=Halalkalibacter lacteus TaxID=3090663 RepID=UPI002FC62C7A